MTVHLVDRLSAIRHRLFVGRAAELSLFRAALEAAELPFSVLHISGPGGVGKTTLLREFAGLCEASHVPVAAIDARHVEPSPEAFVAALALALAPQGLAPADSPAQLFAERSQRHVILIDTCELLAPLDNWLREVFLPQLPDDTLVVLAGRHAPAGAWRSDAGWQNLVRALPLRNLSRAESRAYLVKQAVPDEQHAVVLDFTHGHPLALSLVADLFAQRRAAQNGDFRFQPDEQPDVIEALLEQLVEGMPSPLHRAALETCALARLTTEDFLAEVLAGSKGSAAAAHELFEWLRGLSFIESGRTGILPHDLAREVLIADLRWRHPDWHAELHHRARAYYAARLRQTPGPEQERILFDYIFLHRNNPVVRPFFEWQQGGNLSPGVAHATELPALLAMVARHEGDESARLAAHWFARQPQGVLVVRDADGEAVGLLAIVALHQAGAEDLSADPAAGATWQYLQSRAPLRPGEGATLFRFWMARDTYQAVSPAQSLIFVNVVRHYLTTPGLAFSFFPCAEPDFWAPAFAYADTARLPEADFEVDSRHYGMYGHDWRVTPPLAWLELLGEREIAASAAQPASPASNVSPKEYPMGLPLVVLSQPDFAAAVQQALRNLGRPHLLRDNPLLRARLVVERAGAAAGNAERVAALQALLQEACESLRSSPREAKFHRALHHTYLRPAPSQEQAAESLDLPFSTFRRHLRAGIAQVTETLWRQEVGNEEFSEMNKK